MEDLEKKLIENLFHRLKNVEQKSENIDVEASEEIKKFIKQQPNAPYYMTQSILIQEAALKKLNKEVEELKNEINRLNDLVNKTKPKSSFLKNLFQNSQSQNVKEHTIEKNTSQTTPINNSCPTSNIMKSSSGFLSGALQTAVGVAGGMVLGNMLTNMFNHSSNEEIVHTINEDYIYNDYNNDDSVNEDFDYNDSDSLEDFSNENFNEFNSNDDNFIDDDDDII